METLFIVSISLSIISYIVVMNIKLYYFKKIENLNPKEEKPFITEIINKIDRNMTIKYPIFLKVEIDEEHERVKLKKKYNAYCTFQIVLIVALIIFAILLGIFFGSSRFVS